jgi:hypothetical protein
MRRQELHSGVRRRQSILPTQNKNPWRPHRREYTRRPSAASSPPQETDPSESVSCNRSRPIKNWLPAMSGSQHVASTQYCARQPFRWSICARHHPLAHSRHPTALPVCRSIPAATSVAAFIDFYSGHTPGLQGLNHFADHAKHRIPLRLLRALPALVILFIVQITSLAEVSRRNCGCVTDSSEPAPFASGTATSFNIAAHR